MYSALNSTETINELFIRTLSYTENSTILTYTRNIILPDKTISYGHHPDQIVDIYRGRSCDRPLVILIHGGHYNPQIDRKYLYLFAHTLAKHHKWQVAVVEYRRIYGKPNIYTNDILEAVRCARHRAKNHNGKIILIGHSAGGQFALWLNSKTNNISGIMGTIALAPVTDLIQRSIISSNEQAVKKFLGDKLPLETILKLNPISLQYNTNPITIIHGDLDIRVPLLQSVYFVKKFEDDAQMNIKYIEVRNIGHFEVVDPRDVVFNIIIEELLQFI